MTEPVLQNIAIKVWDDKAGHYETKGIEFRLSRVPCIGEHVFAARLDGGGELTVRVTHVHHIPAGMGDTAAEVYGELEDFERTLKQPFVRPRPVHIPGM